MYSSIKALINASVCFECVVVTRSDIGLISVRGPVERNMEKLIRSWYNICIWMDY